LHILQRSAHFAAKRSFCSKALILQQSAHFAAKRSFCSEAFISQKGWGAHCKMNQRYFHAALQAWQILSMRSWALPVMILYGPPKTSGRLQNQRRIRELSHA
jgi:hypothetical protein